MMRGLTIRRVFPTRVFSTTPPVPQLTEVYGGLKDADRIFTNM